MSSYRSYVPWSKSNLSSSYTGSGSSYPSIPKTSDSTTAKTTTTDQKYDSGYTGRRYGVPSASPGLSTGTSSYRTPYTSTDRATTPSKYCTTTPSASSYLSNKEKDKYSSSATSPPTTTKDTKENDRPAMSIREKYNMGPALPSTTTAPTTKAKETTDKPSTRDNYSSKDDRQSLIDKYSTSSYPSRSTDSSKSYSTLSGTGDKKEDTSSGYTSRSLSRTSKTESNPEPEKTSNYNSLSPYRLYGRTSSPYSRTTSKETESTSSTASTPATTPVTTPASLRFGSSTTRYGGSIASRSPVNDRPSLISVTSPTPDSYRNRPSKQETDDVKPSAAATAMADTVKPAAEKHEEKAVVETKMVSVVTRGTSPTAPSTSSFLRTRRDNLARIIEKTVERPVKKPEMVDKEIQSDRGDDTARLSRFGSTSRSAASPWTSYLDRLSTSSSGYSPTVSKYSTKSYTTPASSRSDRDSCVTTTPPSDTITTSETSVAASSLTSSGKEETKEVTKKIEKVSSVPGSDETVVKTSIKKSPSVKKVGEPSLKKTASVKKADDSNVNKAATAPKTVDIVPAQNVTESSTTKEVISNKKSLIATSTGVNEEDKKATNDTPVKLVLKKSPSITKLNIADQNIVPKLPASKVQKFATEATKSVKDDVETNEESRALNKTTKTVKTSLKGEGALVTSEAKAKDLPSEIKEKLTSTSATVSKVGSAASTEALSQDAAAKVKKIDEKQDVAILKGALAGLIRATTEKPAAKRLSMDSQSESESDNQKTKSSPSTPSVSSESEKLKSPPLSPCPAKTASFTKLNSPAANRKLLPPPVPKPDSPNSIKTSTSQHSLNKDFRKSTLNMGTTSPTEVEEIKKVQDVQRKAVIKKTKRSTSASSDVSETSETSEAQDKHEPVTDTTVPKTTEAKTLPSSSSTNTTTKTTTTPTTTLTSTTNTTALPPPKSTTASTTTPCTTLTNVQLQTSPTANTNKLQVPTVSQASRPPSVNIQSESSSGETDTSETTSESSSDDEVEDGTPSRSSASNLPKTSQSSSLAENNKSLLSPTSSKCVQSVSSADESSLAEKPPRAPSSPKPPQKEEAKSFLMRALAPVTNLFKTKSPEPGIDSSNENISESSHRTDSVPSLSLPKSTVSDQDDSKKSESVKKGKHKIRHIESGERAWWLESSDNIPGGVQRVNSSKSVAKLSSESESENKKNYKLNKKHKLRHIESGERAWWLDSSSSIPEGIEKTKSTASLNRINESGVESEPVRKHKIRHVESGERAWWMGSNSNIPEGIERIKSNASITKIVESNEGNSEEGKKMRKIRKQESGERAWWLDSSSNIPEGVQRIKSNSSLTSPKDPESNGNRFSIRHQESGEKAWWMNGSSTNIPGEAKTKSNRSTNGSIKNSNVRKGDGSDGSEEETTDSESEAKPSNKSLPKFPLDISVSAASPSMQQSEEGTGRTSPYDNVLGKAPVRVHRKRPKNLPLFISNHRNIDDILGTAATLVDPVMGVSRMKKGIRSSEEESEEEEDCKEVNAEQVRIHDSTAKKPTIQRVRDMTDEDTRNQSTISNELDDTALQLYKDGDYGSYLDLEASISEQQEEFDGFQTNRKNSIVLRTQLSVRVHTIIEKLLNSEGRELRRALFSLKQIFQEDKDLVHEFVQNDGLACLIKVGSEADQNYQNYILRALGQVMLYVDGMNGVMDHNRTVQWLYTLVSSRFRLVVKTALKLLLVFVEYVDTNCMLLVKAVYAVDSAQGLNPWSNVMRLLKDYDAADTELLIYATTLLNKTLNGVPDQDTYYDQVDALEEQGIEGAIQRYMSKQGTDLDLLRQFQIYEAVLHHEDGEEKGTPLKQLDETIRKTLRNRKSPAESLTLERRKSRRHSTGTSPYSPNGVNHVARLQNHSATPGGVDDGETSSSSARSSPGPGEVPQLNGAYKDKQTGDAGVTPALRRRRERAERQRSFIREQQETSASLRATRCILQDGPDDENELNNSLSQRINNGSYDNSSNKLTRVSSRKDVTPLMNAVNKMDSADNECKSPGSNGIPKKPAWTRTNSNESEEPDGEDREGATERKLLLQLKRESTVKDLTQKLASQNILNSPVEDKVIRIGDMSGLISKAKEGLAKSKSKADVLKSASGEIIKLVEMKKSETELHWEELVSGMSRDLSVCDLDFTDLKSDDEVDVLSPAHVANGIPPPPPPAPPSASKGGGPPPPPPNRLGSFVPPPPCPTTPTSFGVNLRHQRSGSATSPDKSAAAPIVTPSKTKKTVKLFWKEVRDDTTVSRLQKTATIWDEMRHVEVDTQKLEHLFESRAKDLIAKKQQELSKTKEIIVLDHKRSNAINIGMTKLPPPRSIKTAIMKMDATIMTREGIEKLLTMLPTEDEQTRIQEAQISNPDMPLGSAEQFLLTLASISELSARLKLWAFKLDYENSEKEIAEPLMDLKQGVETLRDNKTFRGILSTLLSIGIFLNGAEVKGFEIEYLAKVPEVKDTVHKHSLLHHLCHMVMEKFPEATDLYSEIGSVTRASKVDFDELALNLAKMEQECKASWDHLKDIAKHDGSTIMKVKMTDFLADCAERIIVLGIVQRRIMNRYHKFLVWLGIPFYRVPDMKPKEFCRIVSEFALEYRTTRERVLQQLEKKANHRERNKTRGKMITEVGKFHTKEDRADAELRHLLGTPVTHGGGDLTDADVPLHGTLPWRRQRKDVGRTVLGPLHRGGGDEAVNGNMTDGDDEILESLVKTATKAPGTRTTPRERKRTRHADLKRSRTRENNVGGEGSASP